MKKSRSAGYDFPRVSISGTLILSVNLIVSLGIFFSSGYGRALWSGNLNDANAITTAASQLPNTLVFWTSLLNVLSHSAVVLGALHDTFVISILIGVGFDVLTRVLQLFWWVQLVQIVDTIRPTITPTIQQTPHMDNFFLGVLSLLFLYQLFIHIRALLLVNNDSLERMQTVLEGALNNLRGIPGDHGKDHWFAYSDLSLHLLPCWLLTILLHQQEMLHSTVQFLLVVTGVVAMMAPLQTGNYNKNEDEKKHDLPFDLLQIGDSGGDGVMKICCNCKSCVHRTKRTGRKTTFVCNPLDGLCALWMLSFEEVSTVMNQAQSKRRIDLR